MSCFNNNLCNMGWGVSLYNIYVFKKNKGVYVVCFLSSTDSKSFLLNYCNIIYLTMAYL